MSKQEEVNKGGRPPKYNLEMVMKAKAYLALCKDKKRDIKGLTVKIPTKGGLASFLAVSRDTLYEWAREHKEFSDIMEKLGSEQEDRLINNGLSGDYNPTIAKVLLTKHGYVDKAEVDNTHHGEVNFINDMPRPKK